MVTLVELMFSMRSLEPNPEFAETVTPASTFMCEFDGKLIGLML